MATNRMEKQQECHVVDLDLLICRATWTIYPLYFHCTHHHLSVGVTRNHRAMRDRTHINKSNKCFMHRRKRCSVHFASHNWRNNTNSLRRLEFFSLLLRRRFLAWMMYGLGSIWTQSVVVIAHCMPSVSALRTQILCDSFFFSISSTKIEIAFVFLFLFFS